MGLHRLTKRLANSVLMRLASSRGILGQLTVGIQNCNPRRQRLHRQPPCSAFSARAEVVILSQGEEKNDDNSRTVWWDGANLDTWAEELDGADVVINLAGFS